MIKPLTDYENKYVRWYIWEPLRRNTILRLRHTSLFSYEDDGRRILRNLDPKVYDAKFDPEDAFCREYCVPYVIDPDTEFEEINDPEWYFFEHYSPRFEKVVSLDLSYTPNLWLVHGCLLPLFIHSGHSQNSVLEALEKELNDWWRKWKDLHRGEHWRLPKTPPILVGETIGPYQRILVNLAATRKAIVAATKNLPRGPQGIQLPRHNFRRMELAFKVWDDSDPLSLSAEEVASRKFGIPKSTAYDMLNEVSGLIYGVSYLRSRPLRQLISKEGKNATPPGRELEVALLNDYQGDITVLCHVPAVVDEILAIPNLRKPKRDPLQYSKRLQQIEDSLIWAIDYKTALLQGGEYEKDTPVKPESLCIESYFLFDESNNFVKRDTNESQTDHPSSAESSKSHRR